MTAQPSDHPITSHSDDQLGRLPTALAFAQQVMELDATQGLVVAVLGPWGSGKTSFLNLARPKLQEGASAIVDFNPWMFSGTDQLIESFFIELSAQLKVERRLGDIADELAEYGDAFSKLAWLPLAGSWIARLGTGAGVLGKLIKQRRQGTGGLRTQLTERLSELDQPIVVVVDDLDRLDTAEIRDIFKLVRLTAAFPNIVYVLAFDRERVERALSEDGIPGRAYLEKILQVAIDLPQVPREVYLRQLADAIDKALELVEDTGPFHSEHWPDLVAEVILPLVVNMRDVRRYAAAVPGAVRSCHGQVALADLLALEAVRVFLPEVMVKLVASVDALTATTAGFGGGRSQADEEAKAEIEALLDAAGEQRAAVRALIERLFPAALRHTGGSSYGGGWRGTWLKERRVAHPDVLRVYTERVLGQSMAAFSLAESVFSVLENEQLSADILEGLEPEPLQNVISSLEAYESEFRAEQVVPGSAVLLNSLDRLPTTGGGMLEVDPRFTVTRVVLRLLRKVGSEEAVKDAVDQILERVPSLRAQFELISLVGHRENAGHKLVAEVDAPALEREWRQRLRSASRDQLASETDLLRIVTIASRELEDGEEGLDLPDDPGVTGALVRGAHSEVKSQSMGSRAVRRESRLHWDSLVAAIGSEQELARRVAAASAAGQVPDNLKELIDRYLGGWRPEDF